jgi:mannose-6-phosphate isomerase-like protein (cupin superfamily)
MKIGATIQGSGPRQADVVLKPWGAEFIFAVTDKYAGKILYINSGQQLSFQYHVHKDETIMVLNGLIELVMDLDQRHVLQPFHPFRICPQFKHRFKAIVDSVVLEVSSPELHDVVRITDDYGRTNGQKE